MVSKSQVVWDLLALGSLFGIIITIVWIHLASPLLTYDAPLSDARLNGLSVMVAITATLYTMFVTGRIRHAFIRSLECDLCNISTDADGELDTHELKRLERLWRAILRIDVLNDWITHLPSCWIFLRYLVTGLLTASIITTFTPRGALNSITYDLLIPGTSFPPLSDIIPSWQMPCTFLWIPTDVVPANVFAWPTTNGSLFAAPIVGAPCPAADVVPLIDGINTHNPDEYVYVDSGIAVQRSAMGASRNLFNSPRFSDLFTKYGHSLNSTTQCIPVMKSNPVKCTRDDTAKLTVLDDFHLNLSVSIDVENLPPFAYNTRNLSRDNVMANAIGPITDPPNMIGHTWMEFAGFTGDPHPTGSPANDLALIMGEPNHKTIGLAKNSTYAATCIMDPNDSFEYRYVTLLLNYAPINTNNHTGAASRASSQPGYTRSLVGGEKCTPAKESVGWPHFAAASTAMEKLVNENNGRDHYFNTIQRIASRWGRIGPPFAFPDSQNALEDSLGVVAALAVSTMGIDEEGGSDGAVIPEAILLDDGNKSGNRKTVSPTAAINVSGFSSTPFIFALVLIPPVLTFAVLLHLFVCSFRPSWQPGGGTAINTGHQGGTTASLPFHTNERTGRKQSHKQGTTFVAESLTSLIALGGHVVKTSSSRNSPRSTRPPTRTATGMTEISLAPTLTAVSSPEDEKRFEKKIIARQDTSSSEG
ncbi:hypothetical protein V8F33_008682 [Rhypophila sp. PSN 637]